MKIKLEKKSQINIEILKNDEGRKRYKETLNKKIKKWVQKIQTQTGK